MNSPEQVNKKDERLRRLYGKTPTPSSLLHNQLEVPIQSSNPNCQSRFNCIMDLRIESILTPATLHLRKSPSPLISVLSKPAWSTPFGWASRILRHLCRHPVMLTVMQISLCVPGNMRLAGMSRVSFDRLLLIPKTVHADRGKPRR